MYLLCLFAVSLTVFGEAKHFSAEKIFFGGEYWPEVLKIAAMRTEVTSRELVNRKIF